MGMHAEGWANGFGWSLETSWRVLELWRSWHCLKSHQFVCWLKSAIFNLKDGKGRWKVFQKRGWSLVHSLINSSHLKVTPKLHKKLSSKNNDIQQWFLDNISYRVSQLLEQRQKERRYSKLNKKEENKDQIWWKNIDFSWNDHHPG